VRETGRPARRLLPFGIQGDGPRLRSVRGGHRHQQQGACRSSYIWARPHAQHFAFCCANAIHPASVFLQLGSLDAGDGETQGPFTGNHSSLQSRSDLLMRKYYYIFSFVFFSFFFVVRKAWKNRDRTPIVTVIPIGKSTNVTSPTPLGKPLAPPVDMDQSTREFPNGTPGARRTSSRVPTGVVKRSHVGPYLP
jgi:hypothetical protein